MNKSTTTSIRGILALGIVLCHVNYNHNIFQKKEEKEVYIRYE